MKRLATEVLAGDTVTYCGATFKVAFVQDDETSGLRRFAVVGGMDQWVAPEREVEISRLRPIAPDPKPYKVLTRDYSKTGKKDVRRFEFATKTAQERFISNTKRCVTFATI